MCKIHFHIIMVLLVDSLESDAYRQKTTLLYSTKFFNLIYHSKGIFRKNTCEL